MMISSPVETRTILAVWAAPKPPVQILMGVRVPPPKTNAELDFADWVVAVFGQAEEPFRWIEDADLPRVSPTQTAEYLARLFETPKPLARRFDPGRIANGLCYLESQVMEDALRDGVPLALRERWIRAVYTRVCDLFAPNREELEL